MMGGDTTRNKYSSFPEINKLCNVAHRWKYIKRNILTMRGLLNVKNERCLSAGKVSISYLILSVTGVTICRVEVL